MKPPQDPPRLLDPSSDAPASLRSALEAGARDVPSAARLAGIAARLPGGIIGGPTGSGPSGLRPPVPPAPALPSVLSGAAVGAALGLAVVGVGWLASVRSTEPPPARPAPVAVVATAAPELPRPAPVAASRPGTLRPLERPAPLPSAPASPSASASAAPEPVGSALVADPGLAAPTDPGSAETEATLLGRAMEALRGDPAQALALTDLHRSRFTGGRLAQEREVIAIRALLALGRAAEARARATRFAASFPASAEALEVLIPDLRSSTESHKDSSPAPFTR